MTRMMVNRHDQGWIHALHKSKPRPPGRHREDWYLITDQSDTSVAEIYIYDEIGLWGITAAEFCQDLRDLEAEHVDLHINSPGGDVWDGIAIYNALCNHPASVTTWIDGLAASAASFIAQAGSRVAIARNATVMIHDAEGICIGNSADMAEMAELLDRASNNIADIYAQRYSTVKSWRKAMQEVSWYVGQEAVDAGLADESYDPEQGADGRPAKRQREATDRARVHHVPRPVSTACPSHETSTTDEGSWDADAEQRRLPSPMLIATARKMYGYYDSSRVEDGKLPKDACKLPHHVVSEGGTPGAAHMGGVRNALARLPQSDIPDEEHDAIRAHLNRHLEDGGGEPSDNAAPDITAWWNPEVFTAAVATAADQRALYGFDPDAFRDSIRAVAEDMPASEPEQQRCRAPCCQPTPGPTITRSQFEEAIKRGLL